MKTLRTQLITTSAAALALLATPFALAQQSDRGAQSENPTTTRAQSDTTDSQQQPAASATGQPAATAQPDYSADTQPSSTAQQDTTASQQPSETASPSATELQTAQSTQSQQIADAQSQSATAGRLQIADDDAKDRSDRKLAGRKVRGSDGKNIGNVKDFLVDPLSGEVVFGVVSSGGFVGIGDKNYLVPFKALQSGTDKDEYTISLGKAEWDQLTPIDENEFKEGRLTLTDDERRQIAQRFESAQTGGAATGSSFYTASISSHLVRASDIRGRDVHAGSEEIGTIEGLVIDADAGQAMALFDAKRSFTDANAKFLVPLNKFTLGTTKRDRVTTMLTRVDFDQVQSGLHTDAADTTAAVTPSGADIATTRVQETFDTTTIDQTADQRTGTTESAGTTVASGTTAITDTTASTGATATTTDTTDEELSATGRTSTEESSSVASTTPRSSSASPTASQTPSRTGVTPSESGTTPSGQTTARGQTDSSSTPSSTTTATDTEEQSQLAAGRTSSGQSASAAGVASVGQPSSTTDTQSTTTQDESTSTVASTSPTTSTESELSPTGQTSAEQSPAGADAALLSAAQAIRTMLDEDDSLARLDVRVSPENGKLVLRGKVKDEAQKKSIEEKAEQAASGKTIDSKITVENR